jgi:hypothetical protein
MNEQADGLGQDQIDDDLPSHTISDEALEAAAGADWGAKTHYYGCSLANPFDC